LNVRSNNLVQAPDNWRAIECVARALLERRTISAREARRLKFQATCDLYQ
jgi:hypothetical protein